MTVEGRLEGIVEKHVGVERVIPWACLFLCHRVIEWSGDLRLVREELSEFKVGSDAICLIVVGGAL